jgi:multiple sugar transport system substrate-binding protein
VTGLTRRAFGGLAVGAGLAASTAACGQKWGGSPSSGGKVQLTYALWDAYEQVGYQKSIDMFEQMHPNIKVTIEQIPYNSYQAKIVAEFISDTGPDLFWINTPFLADWIHQGIVADITDRVAAAKIDLSIYYPALVKLHEKNGRLYGLPKDWDTICFYYNKDFVEKQKVTVPASLTWHPDGSGTFIPFMQQLTVDKNGNNATSPKFDASKVATYATSIYNDPQSGYGNFIAMNGGAIVATPYAGSTVLDSAANVDVMNWITKTLAEKHVVAPPGAIGQNANGSNLETLFSEGAIATYLAGDWNTNSLYQLTQAASGFKVGVMPLPVGPNGQVSVFNGLADGLNARSKHPEEAWQLVQWLASEQSQRILGSGGYVWPAIESLDPLFQQYWKSKGIDVTPFLTEAKGKTVNFPVAYGIANALTDVQNTLGPMFLGTTSVQAALSSAKRVADHQISSAALY